MKLKIYFTVLVFPIIFRTSEGGRCPVNDKCKMGSR